MATTIATTAEIPKEIKAYIYRKYGGPKVMELATIPTPSYGEKDVLVKVHASSINPIDYKRRQGLLKLLVSETFPIGLGYDVAGVVVAVGVGVTSWKVGDEVIARVKDSRTGTVAEYIAVDSDVVAYKPKNLDFNEAASIPLAGLTAYQSLETAGVKEGSTVLITGGAGGVGSIAVQLAKHVFKASVVTTTASPGEKTELVKRLGADVVINYREANWEQKHGDKYDNAFDSSGDAAQAIHLTKPGGVVVSVAAKPTSEALKAFNPGFIVRSIVDLGAWGLTRAACKAGVTYKYIFMHPGTEELTLLATTFESGAVKPLIASVFPLEKASDAFALLESGRATGKVVITVP